MRPPLASRCTTRSTCQPCRAGPTEARTAAAAARARACWRKGGRAPGSVCPARGCCGRPHAASRRWPGPGSRASRTRHRWCSQSSPALPAALTASSAAWRCYVRGLTARSSINHRQEGDATGLQARRAQQHTFCPGPAPAPGPGAAASRACAQPLRPPRHAAHRPHCRDRSRPRRQLSRQACRPGARWGWLACKVSARSLPSCPRKSPCVRARMFATATAHTSRTLPEPAYNAPLPRPFAAVCSLHQPSVHGGAHWRLRSRQQHAVYAARGGLRSCRRLWGEERKVRFCWRRELFLDGLRRSQGRVKGRRSSVNVNINGRAIDRGARL